MYRAQEHFHFSTHLKFLYKSVFYTGLIHFRYNDAEEKFQISRAHDILTTGLLNAVKIVYGALHFVGLTVSILTILNFVHKEDNSSSIDVQERILAESSGSLRFVTPFIHACHLVNVKNTLLPIANELMEIYKSLRSRTDSTIYLDRSFSKIFTVRLLLTLFIIKNNFYGTLCASIYFNFLAPYALLMCTLMYLVQVYSQMALISFYKKMNDYLEATRLDADVTHLTNRVREFMEISFRISRVKKDLDKVFWSVFATTYLGLFEDIKRVYEVLKIVVYSKYVAKTMSDYFIGLNLYIPLCFSASFDMYFIGRLADMLVEANENFQRTVLKLNSGEKLQPSSPLNREIEQMLYQDTVYNLDTLTFGGIKIDQQFAFDYAINIIVVFVIMCLQFFASEKIYSQRS